MTTEVEVGNGRAGLKRVIQDLQNEHSRFQARLANVDNAFPLQAERQGARLQLVSKLDYLELLIRRYRSWLRD